MFATVIFGLLSPADGTLQYINAGHEEPLLFASGAPTGPAVGMLPHAEFKVEQITLAPGESLLLHADGVTDALGAQDERFSEARLLTTASRSSSSAPALLNSLVTALDSHIGRTEQFDDLTLLTVHRAA